MTELPLHRFFDPTEFRRWSLSAVFVVFIYATVIAGTIHWFKRHNDFAGTGSDPMVIDLISAPPSQAPRSDAAPGPEMQQAPAPAPQAEKRASVEQEQIAPAPLQQNPAVVAPPEQKEKPDPTKDKPKPVVAKPPEPTEAPAPRTTAPPQAMQAARERYDGRLSAHLQRYKEYPRASRSASEQGVAMLTFTVNRNGQVSGARIAKSSGFTALDNETLAMIQRAQPLPSFPPEMPQSSLIFTVPIRYSLH